MMQPQQTPQVPEGLQALFVLQDPKVQQALNVLKQQAAPAAQGPQGEPTPTVSGQVLQSFSPPQPQMPPGMPPQGSQQGADMEDVAENAATGSNIQGMQQQQAQEALMKQLMMQQQAQAQQPVMAASGGIASLNARNMEDFADGGVVGFAYGGNAEFDTGAADEYQLAQDEERVRKLIEERKRRDQAFMESRAKATAEATGSIDNLATNPQPTPVDTAPARFVWGQGMDPRQIISVLNNQLKTDKELTPENRTAIAKEIERQYEIYRSQQPIVTAEESARRAAGSTAAGEAAYQVPGQALYQDVLQKIGQLQAPSSRTEEEIQSQREAAYARRGLPNLRQAAEDRIRQTTAFDEESRRQMAEANKASMQNAWASGILQPGARNLAEMFGGAARGMIGEEGRQAQAAIAQRAIARSQLLLDNQIREALDKADIAAANGDLVTEQAEKSKAQEFSLKKQELQIGAMTARSKEEAQFGTQMDVARLNAEQREQAAALRAIVQQQGQQIRAGGKSMTYNEASDNVQKMMESPAGFMEVSSIKAAARKEGRPEPTLSEIKEILVQRELRAAGALPAGGQTAPAIGTVMQGYRFKGGNPADQNNWEKV